MSLVREEISEPPAAVARVPADGHGAIAAAAEEIRRRRPRSAVIAARGCSDNAARYAQHVLGRLCGLPVALATPSLHTVYDAPMDYTDGLVVGISQPGARTLSVEPLPEWLSSLCAVVPAQLLAVGAAERRGVDVDRPAGLQKVTRTRSETASPQIAWA